MHGKVGIGEGICFMSMMVSAAAMDSENPVIPGSICLVSALAGITAGAGKTGRDKGCRMGRNRDWNFCP